MSINGTHLRAGEGACCWILTDLVRSLVTGGDSGGRFMLSETITVPRGGPPPHLHRNEDEVFYILDGEFDFLVNDKVVSARPGSLVFGPRNVPHQYRCNGPKRGRFLVWVQPAGFERFFADIAIPVTDPAVSPSVKPETLERLSQACTRFGIEMLPEHRETGRLPPLAPPTAINVLGSAVRVLCDGAATNGTLTVTETTAPPGFVLPLHCHRERDQVLYILEGRFEIQVRDQTVIAATGDTIFIPRGTNYGFRSLGPHPGRQLNYVTPAGIEHYLNECAGMAGSGPTQMDRLGEVMKPYGIELSVNDGWLTRFPL